jgi:hypothetical protein
MLFSSTNKFSEPDQRASRTTAIKPEVRVVKQLDDGIDDTFVSSVREGVSFASIDFQDQVDGEKRYASGMKAVQSIRKYGQYHRPIARPILFWLNGDSLMSQSTGFRD